MKLLIIDSNPGCSFAAYCSESTLIVSRTTDFMSSAEQKSINKSPDKLIHCLHYLTNRPDVKLNDIDAVSVTIGPGSFTGIRVGLAIAKGTADSLDKNIIPVNNFELMLGRVKDFTDEKKYCVLIPAKLPEYYYSIREKNREIKSGFVQISELDLIIDNNVTIVGDFSNETDTNLSYFKTVNPKEIVSDDELLPEEDSMVSLSRRLYETGTALNPGEIKPLYLKDFTLRTKFSKL